MIQWRTHKELPIYEVSKNGEIRNKKTGKILKKTVNENGYEVVSLSDGTKRYTKRVHRLVAETFDDSGIDRSGLDVVHRDGNKLKNDLNNLMWRTRSDSNKQRGKKICCLETGEIFNTITDASTIMGINRTTISKCVNNPHLSSDKGYHFKLVD